MILPPRGGLTTAHTNGLTSSSEMCWSQVVCSPDLTAPSARKSDAAPWTARAAWSVESESSAQRTRTRVVRMNVTRDT